MIDDLLGGSNKPSKTKIKRETPEKNSRVQISFQSDSETLKLLNEIAWLKQYVIDFKPTSQNDIVKEALALLSKKMDYKKLRAAHAEKLDNLKPKVGRKSKI